jgi:16S rRNA (guanine527-N7)-methyltransferase
MMLQRHYRRLLIDGLQRLGIVPKEKGLITPEATSTVISEKVARFSLFIEELILWNACTNLIGTTEPRDIIIRHIFDSLSVYHLLKGRNASILDVGAGAGFPSVPLAIIDGELNITAVEKREKRAAFLKNIVVLLRLSNLTVVQEDVRYLNGGYDILLARGVGDLRFIYDLTRRLLKEKAMIIAFKGKITEIEKEVSRLKEKNSNGRGPHLSIQRVKVPYLDEEERNIVIIETK